MEVKGSAEVATATTEEREGRAVGGAGRCPAEDRQCRATFTWERDLTV